MMTESKQEREREFHNRTFANNSRQSLTSAYSIIRDARVAFENAVLPSCAGLDVLEYGCGQGTYSFELAGRGARVTGIDISDVAIEQAKARAAREGKSATYIRMDCENLTFPAASFDLVCGVAILHHLDLEKAYTGLARVLRPGGRAVFIEPLGHNPAINLFRRATPKLRTPDEHPLLMRDFDLARKYFGQLELQYFNCLTLMAVALRSTPLFKSAYNMLGAADRLMFRALPPSRRMAWQVVMMMTAASR